MNTNIPTPTDRHIASAWWRRYMREGRAFREGRTDDLPMENPCDYHGSERRDYGVMIERHDDAGNRIHIFIPYTMLDRRLF